MMSRKFWYGLLLLVQVLGAAYQGFLLLSGYTGIGENHPVIGFSLTQILLWLSFQVSLTVLVMRNEERIEGFLPYSVLLALSMFWPEALPIGIYGSGFMVVCFQILSFAILMFLIGKVDWVRLCSSIRKENTWYPMLPLVSLGISILQLVDRIPVLLRLWNILDHSKSDFYWRLFEVVDDEVLLIALLTSFLIMKNKKFLVIVTCLYCSFYVPSVLLNLLVLKTTSPIPFYHSVISLYLVYRQKESLQKLFGTRSSVYTDNDGAASEDEEESAERLESQWGSDEVISGNKESSSLLSYLLSHPKRYGYPNVFVLMKEKLVIAPLVMLFGNQSSDNGEGVVTKGLEAMQERPTVDVTLEQDDNSNQSFENSRQPVNGVLTNKGNASSLYSYLFALPKWLGLTYYGLGIIGLLLTGPVAFIFFYATCVHLMLFTIGFVLSQYALNIDSRLLWSTSSIFYVLSVVVGLILPLQLLSFSVFIVVILGAIFWEKRPKVLRDRW
jgi:membrane protein